MCSKRICLWKKSGSVFSVWIAFSYSFQATLKTGVSWRNPDKMWIREKQKKKTDHLIYILLSSDCSSRSDCVSTQNSLACNFQSPVSLMALSVRRPCGKPNPSITAQHELVFSLQGLLLPDTFISHWHSKGPQICHQFDLDHSYFSSFLPSSCRFHLLFTITKISPLHFIVFTSFTYLICSPFLHAFPPLISRCP